MSERDKAPEPLYPYHIIRSEQHSEAIKGDIVEILANARHDLGDTFQTARNIEEAQAVLQMVSVGVLLRLNETGAKEAGRVLTDLEGLGEDDPVLHNLSSLSSVYDGYWHDAFEPSKREELRRLTAFSHAAFAISAVAALHSREPAGTAEESSRLYPYAAEAVDTAATVLSPESYAALQSVLHEVHDDLETL